MRRERSGNIISRSGMSLLNPTIRGSMRTTASTDLKNFARIRTILSCRTVIAVLFSLRHEWKWAGSERRASLTFESFVSHLHLGGKSSAQGRPRRCLIARQKSSSAKVSSGVVGNTVSHELAKTAEELMSRCLTFVDSGEVEGSRMSSLYSAFATH